MTYREFGGLEKISLLGFGCMRLPKITPDKEEIDYAAAQKLVDCAYAGGVNYFDTAYPYHGGSSEPFIGQALAKYPRNSFYLASKLPIWKLETHEDVTRIFEEQLRRCRVDYFDFYLCHSLNARHFEAIQRLRVLDALEALRRQGKICHLGFSFHDSPEVLEKICDAYNWEFVQLQINPLDWEVYRSEEQYQIAAQRGLPCIVMEPVRGGALANLGPTANGLLAGALPGQSAASWALRFSAGLPNVLTVLSGMTTLPQLQDNLQTLQRFAPLTPAQHKTLDLAMAAYKQGKTIGCTACRYCMPCPTGVNIPGIFALYNQNAFGKTMEDFAEEYAALPPQENAANCVNCGQCEAACPQGLAIPAMLAKLHTGQRPF
ncbi:MAG: aldo/keto reductase [Oscillospiraceae bacterium]